MGCKNYCLYGQNACCLECQMKDQCNIQCDDIDSYEYAVECPDYVKEDEDNVQPNYWVLTKVFRFPKDEEVE